MPGRTRSGGLAPIRLNIRVGPEWRTFGEDLKSSRALMRQYLKEAAIEVVPQMIAGAKQAAATQSIRAGGAMSQQSRVAESMRMVTTKRGVGMVTGTGGKKGTAMFAAGAEWGSNRFHQFLSPTKESYFMWRSVRSREPAVLAAYERAIDRSVRKAFPS